MNTKETARFCSQLKTLLEVGIPLFAALKLIDEKEKGRKDRRAEKILNKIEGGSSFGDACLNILPGEVLGSLAVAERCGKLEEALGRAAKYYQEKVEIQEKLIGSLIYPLFVIGFCVIMILALIFFVLPGFQEVLTDLGAKSPFFLRGLFSLAEGIRRYWLLLIALAVGAVAATFKIIKAQPRRFEMFLFGLPLISYLFKQNFKISFFSSLAFQLESGISLTRALEIIGVHQEFFFIKETLGQIKEKIENGGSLSANLKGRPLFGTEDIQAVQIGEEASRLAEIADHLSSMLARERELFFKKMTALIEPGLTLLVGLVVAVIALGTFIPLMQVVSNIGN